MADTTPYDLIAHAAWLDTEIVRAEQAWNQVYQEGYGVSFGVWDDEEERKAERERGERLARAKARYDTLVFVKQQIHAGARAYLDAITRPSNG